MNFGELRESPEFAAVWAKLTELNLAAAKSGEQVGKQMMALTCACAVNTAQLIAACPTVGTREGLLSLFNSAHENALSVFINDKLVDIPTPEQHQLSFQTGFRHLANLANMYPNSNDACFALMSSVIALLACNLDPSLDAEQIGELLLSERERLANDNPDIVMGDGMGMGKVTLN